jgi:hypothetical protein
MHKSERRFTTKGKIYILCVFCPFVFFVVNPLQLFHQRFVKQIDSLPARTAITEQWAVDNVSLQHERLRMHEDVARLGKIGGLQPYPFGPDSIIPINERARRQFTNELQIVLAVMCEYRILPGIALEENAGIRLAENKARDSEL